MSEGSFFFCFFFFVCVISVYNQICQINCDPRPLHSTTSSKEHAGKWRWPQHHLKPVASTNQYCYGKSVTEVGPGHHDALAGSGTDDEPADPHLLPLALAPHHTNPTEMGWGGGKPRVKGACVDKTSRRLYYVKDPLPPCRRLLCAA